MSSNVSSYYILASSGASIPYNAFMNTSYSNIGTIAVFYYDFALTMPQEIKIHLVLKIEAHQCACYRFALHDGVLAIFQYSC